jgi:uncharacterized membrane protein YoaK (UPF0700 family)
MISTWQNSLAVITGFVCGAIVGAVLAQLLWGFGVWIFGRLKKEELGD